MISYVGILVPPRTRARLRDPFSVYISPGSPRFCLGRSQPPGPKYTKSQQQTWTHASHRMARNRSPRSREQRQRQDDSGAANISCSAPPRLPAGRDGRVLSLCDGHKSSTGLFVISGPPAKQERPDALLARPLWYRYRPSVPISGLPSTLEGLG